MHALYAMLTINFLAGVAALFVGPLVWLFRFL
jgi:hypothetical protein